MYEELKQMNAELEQLKAAHLEKSKALFTTISSKLFEKHSLLESFDWRQYTPYFNDGEECTFSAHIAEPGINGIDGYDVNFHDEFVRNYSAQKGANGEYPLITNKMYNPALQAALIDVREFLHNINESTFRDMFGDHVIVTVTANGTEVEGYDHD